jgi:hypothetical protein
VHPPTSKFSSRFLIFTFFSFISNTTREYVLYRYKLNLCKL